MNWEKAHLTVVQHTHTDTNAHIRTLVCTWLSTSWNRKPCCLGEESMCRGVDGSFPFWAVRRANSEENEECLVCNVLSLSQAGMDSYFVVPETYMIFWVSKKKRQNCKHKIKSKNKYLFRLRKEIVTNYKHIKAAGITKNK